MSLVGHERLLEELSGYLPPVTLLVGSKSIGKTTLAKQAAWLHITDPADVISLKFLNRETVEMLSKWLVVAPFGMVKVAVVNVGYDVGETLLNRLLKLFEELPETSRVILTTERNLPPTIVGRCVVYQMNLLTDDEVAKVLTETKKFGEAQASVRSEKSGGSLARALKEPEELKLVRAAIRAFQEHSIQALDALTTKWTDEATELLQTWCAECITGRWRIFTSADSLSQKVALQILLSLGPDVRPRFVVRSHLMTILRNV